LPTGEKAATAVFGAILGVLVTLGTLLALVSQVDAHYVTRREYEATMGSIETRLSTIQRIAERDRQSRREDR